MYISNKARWQDRVSEPHGRPARRVPLLAILDEVRAEARMRRDRWDEDLGAVQTLVLGRECVLLPEV
ncbi:hypothetical protein CMI37_10700 [Candidatus Pacearchaeota archaeon]|nr:hypothetical protein [Candidatus Pacearchaeota archaeon]